MMACVPPDRWRTQCLVLKSTQVVEQLWFISVAVHRPLAHKAVGLLCLAREKYEQYLKCAAVGGCGERRVYVKEFLGSFQTIRGEMRRVGERWTFDCSPFATARIYQQARFRSSESGLTVISVGTRISTDVLVMVISTFLPYI